MQYFFCFLFNSSVAGVRVVPEFDTPGHTASIGQTFPNIIADCYDWLSESNGGEQLRWPMFNSVALDVTKSDTKVFVESIITELAPLFPDTFFHVMIRRRACLFSILITVFSN